MPVVPDSFSADNVAKMFDSFDEHIGLEHLALLHINDSKVEFGSGKDRHENIGEGYIGLDGFRHLAMDIRVQDLPWILEVPGFEKKGPDAKNVDILKSCF
jgi:endonuclease IV